MVGVRPHKFTADDLAALERARQSLDNLAIHAIRFDHLRITDDLTAGKQLVAPVIAQAEAALSAAYLTVAARVPNVHLDDDVQDKVDLLETSRDPAEALAAALEEFPRSSHEVLSVLRRVSAYQSLPEHVSATLADFSNQMTRAMPYALNYVDDHASAEVRKEWRAAAQYQNDLGNEIYDRAQRAKPWPPIAALRQLRSQKLTKQHLTHLNAAAITARELDLPQLPDLTIAEQWHAATGALTETATQHDQQTNPTSTPQPLQAREPRQGPHAKQAFVANLAVLVRELEALNAVTEQRRLPAAVARSLVGISAAIIATTRHLRFEADAGAIHTLATAQHENFTQSMAGIGAMFRRTGKRPLPRRRDP